MPAGWAVTPSWSNESTRSSLALEVLHADEQLKPRLTTCGCGRGRVIRSTACWSEAFALVREAAKRAIGQRQFDVQIVGGIAIHNRCIAELETGEGKTLVATMPAFLNALTGKGVHIVTVNDYLARRDAEWMGPIYQMLGLDGRLHSDRPEPTPIRRARLCLRHHLRNGQGARLRLPARRAQTAAAWRRRPPQDVRAGLSGPRRRTSSRRCRCSAPTTSRSSTRPTAS